MKTKKTIIIILATLVATVSLTSCACTTIESASVGIKFKK